MNFDELKALDEQYLMQTYRRFPIALDRGEGAQLWDTEGRAYIDFTSGIGVNALGHGNEAWVSAIVAQAVRLGHASNLYHTAPNLLVAQHLCRRADMANAFFANSGAEANEGMIKLARKYSFDKYGKGRGTILTLQNSFHGRTLTTLSATGQDSFHNYFFPFPEGFRHAPASMDGIEAVAGHDVCAVMIELIQGESGVTPLSRDFVHDLAILCAERDWLLLVDEVQTGIGRTGTLFACQQYGIRPDALSFAKGIAGGLPFGGVLSGEKCRNVLSAGTHGSTFGGNPVCAAAALSVLQQIDDDLLDAVTEKGRYLKNAIESMALPCFGAVRGMGLMLAVEVTGAKTNRELAQLLLEHGLLVLTAGSALRLMPPLTITRAELDCGIAILQRALGGAQAVQAPPTETPV